MFKKDELLVLPIGGLEQVGANSTMIGYNDEWAMIDLGITFYNKLGVEILMPDISFPIEVKDKLQAMLITHAHEDHIGAIPYLWPQLRCPIYTTEFPAAVLRQKFSYYDWKDEVELNVIKANETFKIGGFDVTFVPLAHSIIGSCGLHIRTAGGKIFYTGDWKIDETPLLGDRIEEKEMEKVRDLGVDCLLCDSTNVLNEDKIWSEADVYTALEGIFEQNKSKRITVTCFASNLARMNTILQLALKNDRKVAVIGRSMHRMMEAISQTAYYTEEFQKGLSVIVEEEAVPSLPMDKTVLLCTGSQGEFKSALYRVARSENKSVKLGKDDVVVFSSKVIPGNELEIRELQNMLVQNGAEIITTDNNQNIHVSGHPNKTALRQMYEWTQPKALIPIHGDLCMLHAHEKFAKSCGVKETMIVQSGDVVSVKNGKLHKVHHIDEWMNCIDGTSIIPLDSQVIRDRTAMSCNGVVSISCVVNKEYNLIGNPDVVVSGIYINKESWKKLQRGIVNILNNELKLNNGDFNKIRDSVRNNLRRIMIKYQSKRPHIVLHVHTV